MSQRHECRQSNYPSDGHGTAIYECVENDKGELWAGNDEYGTRVNYCPFCGFKARTPVAVNEPAPELPAAFWPEGVARYEKRGVGGWFAVDPDGTRLYSLPIRLAGQLYAWEDGDRLDRPEGLDDD